MCATHRACLGVVFTMAMSMPARAERVTLTSVKDTSIYSGDETRSNGQGDLFSGITGPGGGNSVQRCLLAFDISAIPEGSTITGATLFLTLRQASLLSNPQVHALHRLLQDWGEGDSLAMGGGGVAAEDGDATWTLRFFPDESSAWDTPGGEFIEDSSATQTVTTTPGQFIWGSTSKLVADVQLWIDQPGRNFGWILLGNESTPSSARKFASREAELESERPTLVVNFDPPPEPEPEPDMMDDDMTDDPEMPDDMMDTGGTTRRGICGSGMVVASLGCLLVFVGMRGRRG